MGPRQEDHEFKALEFDTTLGYPGEGPPRVRDFGSMERCNAMIATSLHGEYHVWKCRKVREMQNCEEKRHGDGEVQEYVRGGYLRRATTLRREESRPRQLQR